MDSESEASGRLYAIWLGLVLPLVGLFWANKLPRVGWAPGSAQLRLNAGALVANGINNAVVITSLAAVVCAVLLACAGAGKAVPTSLVVLLAAAPWLFSLIVAGTALDAGPKRDRLVAAGEFGARAAGLAEAILARHIGALLSSPLLSAVGLGLAVAAWSQRGAVRQASRGALVGLFAGLPVAGFVLAEAIGEERWYAMNLVRGEGSAYAAPLVAAAALLVGLGFAGAAVGSDPPRLRSASLALSASVALAAGLVAAAVAARDRFLVTAFDAASDGSWWGGHMDGQLAATTKLMNGTLGLAVLPVLAILAWSWLRTRPLRPRFAAAVLFVAVTAVLVGSVVLAARETGVEKLSAPGVPKPT